MTAGSDPTTAYEVVIVARDAEDTIAEAIHSIKEATTVRILLVENLCSDATVETAANASKKTGHAFRCVSSKGRTLAQVRQDALDAIDAPYGVWLDADDAATPHRFSKMMQTLIERQADYCFDGAIVSNGDTESIRLAPEHLSQTGFGSWFERNWAPRLTGAFSTSFARKVGYHSPLHTGEDYHHTLSALLAGAVIACRNEPIYLYRDFSASASRDLANTKRMTRMLYRALPIHKIEAFMEQRPITSDERNWILGLVHLQAGRHADACGVFSEIAGDSAQFLERWDANLAALRSFGLASAALAQNDPANAHAHLTPLAQDPRRANPAVLNNIGVCERMLAREDRAQDAFRAALARLPHYVDAAHNLEAPDHREATLLPVRIAPIRDRYIR